MLRFFILFFGLIHAGLTLAEANQQVDLLIFAQTKNLQATAASGFNSTLIPFAKDAIPLKSSATAATYSLLPASKSALADALYQLNHKSAYTVIGHYSWIQPSNNQSPVLLPQRAQQGWQVEGTIRIRRKNYTVLDTELRLSPQEQPNLSFNLTQTQGLKENRTYYIDHPPLGLLIRISSKK